MKFFDLSGKTAMVTGGNGGIGYGIAEGLAQAGADIVIAARNKTKTSDAVGAIRELGVKVKGIEVDVADEASIRNMAKGAADLTGSMTSIFGLDWAVAYASSKGGVVQLTKTLAVTWARDNIQVNTLLPGWIHTDLTRGIREDFPDRYTHILSRIPDGRWGEPADLAGTSVFLSSQASNYVTGISIPVDGGYTSF